MWNRNLQNKEMKIKISPLEISIAAVFIGIIAQDYDYIAFGMGLYQNYYQK